MLFGLPDLPHGARELRGEVAWDPPSAAAGANAQVNITVPGARPGHFCHTAFTLSTSGIVFLAQVGAQDTVTATLWNRDGAAIDLGPGAVRVRVLKG